MMTRRNRLFLLAAALVFACTCNFPVGVKTAIPGAGQVQNATAEPPGAPVVPSATATVTLTPTPSVPQLTSKAVNVNCRSGPDVGYDATSVLIFGQTAQIAGRTEDSSWWYIHDPANPGSFCWVAAGVVTTAGNLAGVPIVAPPAAIVTDVSVDVSIPSTVYCGGPNALDFSGSITTNGTTKVSYRWEIRGDKSNTTSPETLNFKSGGTKDVSGPGAYSVDCGNYSITLHVLSPNDVSATKKFKVKP
jgi:hypothetical protein